MDLGYARECWLYWVRRRGYYARLVAERGHYWLPVLALVTGFEAEAWAECVALAGRLAA